MSVSGPLGATPQRGAFDLRQPFGGGRSLPGPRSLSALRGWLGLAGLVVGCFLVSISASQTNLLLPQSVRPVPASLAGPFGGIGLNLGLAGLIPVFILMFVSYVLAVRSVEQLSTRAVLMCIAALHALVLLAPPLLSTDVFSYGAYARMGALYGANPYLYGPHAILTDPVYSYVGWQWVTMPTAYGPVFTAFSYLLAPLGIAASAFAFKSIAAAASLAAVVLVWHTARLRGINQLKAVAFVGLNPVIVVYGVGGGHNDLLMVAVVLWGLYALLAQRERAGGALIVAAAAIKLTAGLLLPFAYAAGLVRRRAGAQRSLLVGAGIAAATITVLGSALFGLGPLHLLGTLSKIQGQDGLESIPGAIAAGLGLGELGTVAQLLLGVAFLLTTAWLLRRVWTGKLDWIAGAGWATVALLVTTGSLLPWYVGWLVPLAALGRDRRLWIAAVALTGIGLTSL